MLKVFSVFTAVVVLGLALAASAHSTLTTTNPANGATVAAPKTLSLTFSQDLRLVSLRLTADNADDVMLPVDRAAAAAKAFTFPLPALAPATYTVRWTASAKDGHVMKGKFAFNVAAGGEPAAKP